MVQGHVDDIGESVYSGIPHGRLSSNTYPHRRADVCYLEGNQMLLESRETPATPWSFCANLDTCWLLRFVRCSQLRRPFIRVAQTAAPSFEDSDLVLNRSDIGWPVEAMGSSRPSPGGQRPPGKTKMNERITR